MVESADEHAYTEGVTDVVNGGFDSADDPVAPEDVSPNESVEAEDQNDTVQSPHTARQVQAAHTNGHAVQSSVLENGHSAVSEENEDLEPSADPARGQQEEPREELWKKRLYFVRMPKFPEENQYASKAVQEELDVYRSQVQLLNESMNVIRMQRDSAKESVAEARENLNAAVNAFKAKQEEVEPLQKGRKDQNNMQRNVQTEFRDLEVRSEQELDAKIRDMEYHMAHESIPIAQERQMVKHIKKLRDSRQRVRQYEELYADVENARAAVRSGQVELKEMLDERQTLFEDKQLQQTIFNKHRDELRSLDERINEIRDERSRVKEMQDGAYHRLQAIKQQSRGKKDAYYQNRRFSQDVRKMIREGKLEEAKQMCEEQTNGALGALQADPDWRKEYLELWMHQRPPPFRITFDDYDFDEIPRKADDRQQDSIGKGKPNRANGASPAAAPAMTAKEKAQAIIAASFKEVKQDLARKANAGSMSEAVPGSEAALPAPAALPTSERRAESKPAKPSKPSAKPAKPVELPPAEFQTQEPFVPPPPKSKVESTPKEKAAESEAAAAAAREAQMRAQQENQRRKEKAAERKQKANQKKKAREADIKAQEAAAKAEAAAQQQKSQIDTSADSDTQDSSQPEATSSSTAATATSALSSAAAAAADKVPASLKEAPRKVLNQAAKKSEGLKRKLETPKAKKVPRKKNWQAYARQCSKSVVQCSRSAVELGKDYPAQLGLIGVVLLMTVMVFALMNRTSTSTSQRPLAS